MAIKTENLVVDNVYFGYHIDEKTYYFVVYKGGGTWGAGTGRLNSTVKYLSSVYNVKYPVNTHAIIPLCKITKFPEFGDVWEKREALDQNNALLQRAIQAAINWFDNNINDTQSWTMPSLVEHFMESYTESWANKNEPKTDLLKWYFIPDEIAPIVNTVKVEKKKYKIINVPVSSTSKTLFKTQ